MVAQIDPKKLKRKQSVNVSVSGITRQGFVCFFPPRKLKDGGSPYSVRKYQTGSVTVQDLTAVCSVRQLLVLFPPKGKQAFTASREAFSNPDIPGVLLVTV